ncbi:MAG: hypothetical protein ACJ8G7_11440, partial [Rhizobacter sp.]
MSTLLRSRFVCAATAYVSGAAQPARSLAVSQPGHIGGTAGARAEPNLLYATPAQTNLDRNTVDMDR